MLRIGGGAPVSQEENLPAGFEARHQLSGGLGTEARGLTGQGGFQARGLGEEVADVVLGGKGAGHRFEV